MKFYFAPMEGITSYIFRNAFDKYYGGINKYFSPFISPADNCAMNPKEKRDICPENNQGLRVVPQILSNKPEHFIACTKILQDMGYKEINLNFGCPSGTVVSKKKGSGFLTEYDDLERFLDAAYDYCQQAGVALSIKTRIGRYDPEEWYDLLNIYNRFPVSELIVHPRIRDDYYKGEPRTEFYQYAVEKSKNPLVYNGNIYTTEDIRKYEEYCDLAAHDQNKNIEAVVMLGRGILYNPELLINYNKINMINVKDIDCSQFNRKIFRMFHDDLYHGYQEIMAPDINVIYHLKGLWVYWQDLFPEDKKIIKKILKCKKYIEYEALLRELGL
ncbi:MAG: tRNA-dihydrouridine synthase family protein [Lachnospiraceae bacterium]